ncbi:MAG: hypothetical protein CMA88_03745 [Euryarchaeota archaeon]|nr:hypothetical protein [Euryarchaeota archaeon]
MAAKLASSLGFEKSAATDTVREVLRSQYSFSEIPALHRSSFENAGGSAEEDWRETVDAVSDAVQAVISRALGKANDLLMEGVHFYPNREVIDWWKESGGSAVGIVLYVADEQMHRSMIANREKHNGKQVDHYLGNIGRIRAIQEEMVATGSDAGWLLADPTKERDYQRVVSDLLN